MRHAMFQDHRTLSSSKNFTKVTGRGLNIKFCLDWPSGFREKMFENNGHKHVYSPGAGAENPMV